MSEEIYTLYAKSSTAGYYEVTFRFTDGRLSVSCECVAGGFGQLCKHKDAFLAGDSTLLFDAGQADLCGKVHEMVKNSNFQAEFEKFLNQLNDIEDRKRALAKEAKQVKAAFARRLAEGI